LFTNYTFYGDLIQKERTKSKTGLKMHQTGGIDAYSTKTTRTNSSASLPSSKKKLSYYNVNSSVSNVNMSALKAQSPPPHKDKNENISTPSFKTRQSSNRSLLNSSNFKKMYANTPLKYQDSSTKIIDKLPNIDLKKFKIVSKMSSSPSINSFKKNNRNNTLSMDTGSTTSANTLVHRRTGSNFNKNSIIK
jgi:hypothetical protein